MIPRRIRNVIALTGILFVNLKIIFGEGIQVSIVSCLDNIGFKRSGEQTDLAVPQTDQIFYRLLKALLTIAAHRGNLRVAADAVVVEDGWYFTGLKVRHPRVNQGKAEDERADIAVLQHIDAVGNFALEILVHRHNIDRPALRLRHLPETENDVVSELVWRVIVHVFNNNAELLFPAHHALIVIAKLHRCFQNFLAHLVTDVGGIVQTLRHRALRYPKLCGNIVYCCHKNAKLLSDF